VFNVFIFGMIIYNRLIANLVGSWPSVPGKIKTSYLGVGSSSGRTPGTYVSYTFQVEGKTYTSWGISPGLRMSSTSIAKAIVKRYPRGADVTVYYNPRNPSHSYLENKLGSQAVFWVLAVLGNLLMPLIVWLIKFVFAI
jgi:hypothetical protein